MTAPVVDGSPAGSRLDPAFASIRDRSIDVLSVGAFDTLLLTRVVDPTHAHELLGRRLVDAGLLVPFVTATMFAAMRARAEQLARRDRTQRGEPREVTLAEIHAQLPDLTRVGDRAASVDAERALVGDLSFVDPAVHELVRAADAAGISIVVTADSALSESELRDVLDRCGVTIELRAVFTSASRRAGPSSGLFRVVAEELDASPQRLLHVGSAAETDAARAAGLRALPVAPPVGLIDDVVALERIVEEQHGTSDAEALDLVVGDAGLTAARHRFAEQPLPADVPPHAATYWSAGGIVLGPVLAGFAAWVVDGARRRGWRRVHCLPREHTLLAPMLEECARDGGAPVEVGELALSELLCARAAITACDYGELRVFLERPEVPTVRELCRALGLDPTDLGDLVAYPEARLDDSTLREVALGRITGDERVRDRILSTSGALRERVRALVERSVLGDTVVVADLGPNGAAPHALARALRAAGSEVRVAGRSLLTTSAVLDAVFDGAEVDGYLASGGEPAPFLRLVDGTPGMLDRLCAGGATAVVDLASDGSPRRESSHDPRAPSSEVLAAREGIAAFQVLHRSAIAAATTELAVSAPFVRRILQRFASAPTEQEVEMFDDWWPDERVDKAGVGASVQCTLDADTGGGFTGANAVHRHVPVSDAGAPRVRLAVTGERVVGVQLVPVASPAVVRVDRVEARLSVRGNAAPTVLSFTSREELLEWQLTDCSWLADNVLGAPTASPKMVLVIDNELYGDVYSVMVTATMAVLELPQSAIAPDGSLTFGSTRAAVLGQGVIDLWATASDLSTSVARRLKRRGPDSLQVYGSRDHDERGG